jgi:hypothetical protein
VKTVRHFQIKSSPAIVGDLRCVFIKLAGAMEGSGIDYGNNDKIIVMMKQFSL